MENWVLEKNILAKLVVNTERTPLSDKDKLHVISWLRQVANEIEKGDLSGTLIVQLKIEKGK